ncbi:tetratricopeptide repeat protein 29 isoform X2 [Clupea harengus]|uniref:Tetratricopeptide repeat protein 29 n=1 Tax=Clupea harengus TaxID=7950 RepID=A0A6P8GRE7_CLUHA|nr:tetratricopeptide repeat protein 29 isoform X2 [Clupea harengus]
MSASAIIPQQRTPLLPDISTSKISAKDRKTRPQTQKKQSPPADNSNDQTTRVTKDEISLYRNSQRQNVCVAMLREGFHRSFEELFSLLQRFEEARQAGGPDNPLWYLPSLQEQPEKLLTLQTHLTRAETAFRAGNFAKVYEEQLALAGYFTGPGEDWLSLYFHQVALRSAQRVRLDGGRKEAEANANLARVYLEQGQLDLAKEHFEVFHCLSKERPWWDATGRPLQQCACEGLCAVYTQLAQGALQSQEYELAIEILSKAFNIAKEADDEEMQGKVAYWVGLAYHRVGDPKTAKEYLTMSLNTSTVLGDTECQGRAYKAIAKSLESDGKLEEAVQHLEKFAEVSRSNKQQENLEEACMSMGIIYSNRGEYERGVEYLQQAYELAKSVCNVGRLQQAQVCVGVTRAQRMLPSFSAHTNNGNPDDIQRIITWKDRRQDAYDYSMGKK